VLQIYKKNRWSLHILHAMPIVYYLFSVLFLYVTVCVLLSPGSEDTVMELLINFEHSVHHVLYKITNSSGKPMFSLKLIESATIHLL